MAAKQDTPEVVPRYFSEDAKNAFDAATSVNCGIDDECYEQKLTRNEMIDAAHCISSAISHLEDALKKIPNLEDQQADPFTRLSFKEWQSFVDENQ